MIKSVITHLELYDSQGVPREVKNLKHGRRLTREEKVFLKKEGYNPQDFLRIKKTAEGYEFLEVQTGKILSIRR